MTAWTGWVVPLIVTLVLGFAASYYLRSIRLPGEEGAAGIASLADLRWRDFIRMVLDVLSRRGYQPVTDANVDNDGDYLLEREGERWLLSSRHGGSFALNPHAMDEFVKDMHMQGASGGLLVTPGKFAPDIVALAKTKQVQLLDGPNLWPDMRSLLPPEQRAHAAAPVQAQARKHNLMAWAGAAVVGLAVFVLFVPGESTPTAPAVAMDTTQVERADQAAVPVQPVADTTSPAPTDATELQQRRGEVTKLVSTLTQVDRAVWSTQSTLLVYLLDQHADPLSELCPILEHYEELRSSRVQLQPPPGSTRPVRFVQCKSF